MGESTGESQIVGNYSGFLIDNLTNLGAEFKKKSLDLEKIKNLQEKVDSNFKILIVNTQEETQSTRRVLFINYPVVGSRSPFEVIKQEYQDLNGGPYDKVIEKVKTYAGN
ncbi:MAG: hypothetical protein PHG05_00770 [Candidatus Nanoarchaeia archaeon]|nr:hypothetical protein [Candidatus Nanoarchaeia archaeon]